MKRTLVCPERPKELTVMVEAVPQDVKPDPWLPLLDHTVVYVLASLDTWTLRVPISEPYMK